MFMGVNHPMEHAKPASGHPLNKKDYPPPVGTKCQYVLGEGWA